MNLQLGKPFFKHSVKVPQPLVSKPLAQGSSADSCIYIYILSLFFSSLAQLKQLPKFCLTLAKPSVDHKPHTTSGMLKHDRGQETQRFNELLILMIQYIVIYIYII